MELGPLYEASGAVGAFNDDGTVNLAIIRPCTSRGRRLNGLPPLYTQAMLAEEADAFTGWRMFMGHLTPEMARTMSKQGRSWQDLGGRIVESWWNPDYVASDDAERGFERGAVMGRAIPYPAARALLEADPQALAVSINAWPKGAKAGSDAKGRRVAVIEGFQREPAGSVDWVIAAGAGGSVAVSEERAVSLLEAIYDPPSEGHEDAGGDMLVKKLSEMTEDEFRATVAKDAPHLLDALAQEADDASNNYVDADDVAAALAEQEERFEARLEERASALLDERERNREFSTQATAAINRAEGLTEGHRADLREHYAVTDGKPGPGLSGIESAEKLAEAVEADVKHRLDLIRETRPGPRVKTGGDGEGKPDKPVKPGGWVGALQEMGVMPLDTDGKPDKSKLLDGMVS